MPFKKKSGDRWKVKGDEKKTQTTLPPPPEPDKPVPLPTHPIPPRHELTFHCQLAHGSPTKQIKDFSNVKDLYARIAEAFDIEANEIIFCTLNTHKIDMARLLGGQIGLEDFIFAHIKGEHKEVSVTKLGSSLGLTITDNGAGCPFIKKIKEGNPLAGTICVGDMIESIDGRSLVGTRHYEVARILKDMPRNTTFSMKLIEPMKAFAVAPRGAKQRPVSELVEEQLEGTSYQTGASLRLKKNGPPIVEQNSLWEKEAMEKIDELLESFMGIRDHELALVMVELSRGTSSVHEFSQALNTGPLAEFEFPDDFIFDIWAIIESAQLPAV